MPEFDKEAFEEGVKKDVEKLLFETREKIYSDGTKNEMHIALENFYLELYKGDPVNVIKKYFLKQAQNAYPEDNEKAWNTYRYMSNCLDLLNETNQREGFDLEGFYIDLADFLQEREETD